MKRICLVTHTEASHSAEGKVGGWFDSGLTDRGKEQATALVQKIKSFGFDLNTCPIYSSDLKRAHQTATIISKPFNTEPIPDHRLREMSFGSHEGINQEEHNSLMIPVPETGKRMDHRICDGAESRKEVATRIQSFVDEIMKDKEDVIIITHGFAATFFIACFQNISVKQMDYINYRLNPGGITILEEDDLFKNRSVILLNG